MKSIIFITTYKARDFEGQALIGFHLKNEYQIQSYFIDGYSIWKKILEIKPVLVVFDHLTWKHKKELVYYCKKFGIKTVVLLTEGYYKDVTSLDQIIGYPDIDKLNIDLYFGWNHSMLDRAQKISNSNILERFKITGCQRFDFLMNPNLKKLLINEGFEIKYELNKYNKVLTYMSTAAYQGYTFDDFYRRYKNVTGLTQEKIFEIYNESQLLFKNHTFLIKNLALKNPDKLFFYKTHPSETYIQNYHPIFNGIDNIKLIVNENVRPFLYYSDIILQRNCTTALESWLLNKPVVQINDFNYSSDSYEEHINFSFCFQNLDEIDYFINSKDYLVQKNEKLNIFLESIFYKLDGLSYIRISNEIGFILKNINSNEINCINENIKKHIIEDNKKFQNIIKDKLGLSRSFSLRPKTYFKRVFNNKVIKNSDNEVSVSETEVNKFYQKLKNVLE